MSYPATKSDILDLRKLIRGKHNETAARQVCIIKLLAANRFLLVRILKAITKK